MNSAGVTSTFAKVASGQLKDRIKAVTGVVKNCEKVLTLADCMPYKCIHVSIATGPTKRESESYRWSNEAATWLF